MTSHESFDDLEAELLALGDAVDVPAPPPSDVAAAVRARLEADGSTSTDDASTETDHGASGGAEGGDAEQVGPPEELAPRGGPSAPEDGAGAASPVPGEPGSRGRRGVFRRPPGREDGARRPGRRRRLVITAVVVAVVVAITAGTPQGRAAVAHILRLAGIELRISDTPPVAVTPTPLPGERTVTPDQLAGLVKFPVNRPSVLGEPDEVRISDKGRVVSMFWGGVRLDQFDGGFSPVFLKEMGEPWPDNVPLRYGEAWWITGTHRLSYLKRGDNTPLPLRLAEETLLWERSGIGFRLEGVKDKNRAAEIANSLR
ncbi:hypothetical protein [Nonomuraea endophytica]|uniref:Uncharacterized protein n=1 Tax=Nonomuraea endophytica TaxID=714136 RepID=A0A7W8ED54_9ACTN|nr:hypothetical protein [Nonomuraea endophytica]MBB5075159.1 hypothetical protein [Nonomuraea endophytica]